MISLNLVHLIITVMLRVLRISSNLVSNILSRSISTIRALLVKRPMTSISPILVTDSRGDVIFTAGGSGGSRIISSVAQVAMYNLWLGKSIRDAVDMPRLHQQLIPMELELEKRFPVVCSPTISLCSFAGLLSFVECRSWSVGERSYYLGLTWWIRRSSNRTTSSQ